ncbi:hypothetical protein Rhein_1045 [Rheinheimera sp. A13L]|uniref:hypothetical protein n=1 Tax=Rheinheimera sp. A13L TaxID=506534 RepID=UPI00021250D9|nr:hypothetical protein [Rheinheimera sp. A13L]EGM78704.1 hypothetical protein Rhein_1045 [Rheinheimera sp. A13L]
MKFYHFTRRGAVDGILKQGILAGIAPFGLNNIFVSLTSLLDPNDNGLITGQKLVENISPQFDFMAGHYPNLISGLAPCRELQLFDQTEVALEIEIDQHDPNLMDYDSFIDLALERLKHNQTKKVLFKAAGLASARFPIGGPNDAQDAEAKRIINSNQPIAPHWYFYRGTIPASMITVKYRNESGLYS